MGLESPEKPSDLLWMLQQMILIRKFEETLLSLKDEDLINGPVHASIGQEAVAVGVAFALRKKDKITGTHRAHHQYLAKALSFSAPDNFDPSESDLTTEMYEAVRVLLCEIMGLAEGCSGGRGGSMHLSNREYGIAGTNAIVAGGVSHAAGIAWSDSFLGRDNVTVCFLGDGAVYQGVTHEASNLASLWNAPVIYFIENNHYAVATSADAACSASRLVDVAAAYNMPGIQVDGMNVLAVKKAVEEAVGKRGEGWLPCYIEADVYRYFHHAGSRAGSAYGYRDKDEEDRWRDRDAIESFIKELKLSKIVTDEGVRRLQEQAGGCIAKAVDYCTESDAAQNTVVKDSLWPDTLGMADGLRDNDSLSGAAFVEPDDIKCGKEIKYSDAIAAVTGRWLEKDPTVFVLGEEVANFGGGPYGATKGLPSEYPERIRNTPISEAGFCGLACGAAMNGMRPIVEIMFSSFTLVAADQLFNQIGQIAHIYGGNTDVPIVVRTRIAAGFGYGAQHSMDPTALFSLFPGWRIFVPTTAFDYIGLFNSAMRIKSPVVMVEHHEYYDKETRVPENDLDFLVEPGKARTRRQGGDFTMVSYGCMVTLCLEAAEQLAGEGTECEVIDLRTVDDAGVDYEAIGASLASTGILVTVEQAPKCSSIGGKIIAECERRYFDYLDGPSVSVTAPDIPLPVSRKLEEMCMPAAGNIVDAVRKAAR